MPTACGYTGAWHKGLCYGLCQAGDCWNSFLFVVVVFNLSAWLSLGKGLGVL